MSATRVICLSNNLVPVGTGFWGEHGLSFYVEAGGMKVLYDTGQSGDVMLHNARLAEVDLRGLDYVVLSHGHYDHTGGLARVLEMNEEVRLVVHPDAFEKKFARRGQGLKDIGLPFDRATLEKLCRLMENAAPVNLCKEISTTGEIERLMPFETPQPDLLVTQCAEQVIDPVIDDLSLTVCIENDTWLLCGCCHAGIVNTVESVKRRTGRYPSRIAGGLHLGQAETPRLEATAAALKAAGIKKVIAGHCSGEGIHPYLAGTGIPAERLAAGMRII